jgi:hypothetical protein
MLLAALADGRAVDYVSFIFQRNRVRLALQNSRLNVLPIAVILSSNDPELAEGERGRVEGPRECVLCQTDSGSSNEVQIGLLQRAVIAFILLD